MIRQAAGFAKQAHEGKMRKGTAVPYIVHPMDTGVIVSRMTDDPEVISAALLHDVIEDAGVTKEFLIREYNRAKEEKVTPNCRRACSGCGARVYGGGVCFEERKGDEGYDA